MTFIAVKNFEKHQHYKDRRPPWIKLYNELLDDYAFLALPVVMQRHLVMIWLIASRHENRIPNDLTYLAQAIHAKGKVDFDSLFAAGFLTYTEQPASRLASAPLAECSENAMPETEREKETKKIKKQRKPRRGAAEARTTWMSAFCDAWRIRYGGEMPVDPALRPIGTLLVNNERSEVLRRWGVYLAATEGQYANPSKFASTYGQWEHPPPANGVNGTRPGIAGRVFAKGQHALRDEP